MGSGVTTGVFGSGAYLAYAPETIGLPADSAGDVLLDLTSLGLGGMALAAGVGTVGAIRRYRRLTRTPLPEPPPEPVSLPARESAAHEPMRRLRDAEQGLHLSLSRLSEHVGQLDEPVAEARGTAAEVAATLRSVAERLVAVEATVEHAPEAERTQLRADVRRMRAELDDGVERYGALVGAAGRAVAAGRGEQHGPQLRDATDRLAGLASALRELSGYESPDTGELGPPEQPPGGGPRGDSSH
ncbi:phage shock envelope stress response protein PspM [Actinopolyspora sp. H202]|uniref:phage shock envelope stress response protein PspM n=1 Tax=Actinopolyspora sp. H202 TaxID=1500456 RepID=UPI003F49C8B9